MTLFEIEERLRAAVVKRDTRVGVDYTLSGCALDVVTDLLADLERDRLNGIDSKAARP